MKRRLMIAAPVAAIASMLVPGMAFGAEPAILKQNRFWTPLKRASTRCG